MWKYDNASETWFCGTETLGCGVYSSGFASFYANIVHGNNIDCIGPFYSLEEAKTKAIKALKQYV